MKPGEDGSVLIGFLDEPEGELRTKGILTLEFTSWWKGGDHLYGDIIVRLAGDPAPLFDALLPGTLDPQSEYHLKLMYDRTGGRHRAWFDGDELDLADPAVIGPAAAQHFEGIALKVESDQEWDQTDDIDLGFFALAPADATDTLRIIDQPEYVTVQSGVPAEFVCLADGGVPEYEYRWQRGGYNASTDQFSFPADPMQDLIDPGDADFSGQTTSALTVAHTDSGKSGGYRCVVTDADDGYRVATSEGAALTVLNGADAGCQPMEPRLETFDYGPWDSEWSGYCLKHFAAYGGHLEFVADPRYPDGTPCPPDAPIGGARAERTGVAVPMDSKGLRFEVADITPQQGSVPPELTMEVHWGTGADQSSGAFTVVGPVPPGETITVDVDLTNTAWGPQPGEDTSDGYVTRDLTIRFVNSYIQARINSIDAIPGPRLELAVPQEFTRGRDFGNDLVELPTTPTPYGEATIVHPGLEIKHSQGVANCGCAGDATGSKLLFTLCEVETGECHNDAVLCNASQPRNQWTIPAMNVDAGWYKDYGQMCTISPPDLPTGTVLRFRGEPVDTPGASRMESLLVVREDPVTDLKISRTNIIQATTQRYIEVAPGEWAWADTYVDSLQYGDEFSIWINLMAMYSVPVQPVPVYVYGRFVLPGVAQTDWAELGHIFVAMDEMHENAVVGGLRLNRLSLPSGWSWALLDMRVVLDPPVPDDMNAQQVGSGAIPEWGYEYTENDLDLAQWMLVALTEEPGETIGDFRGRHTFLDSDPAILLHAGQTDGWGVDGHGDGGLTLVDSTADGGPNLLWYDLAQSLPQDHEISGIMVRYRREGNHNGAWMRVGTGEGGYTLGDTSFLSAPEWQASQYDFFETTYGQWHTAILKTSSDEIGPFADLNVPAIAAGGVPGQSSDPDQWSMLMLRLDETSDTDYPKATWIDDIWVFVSASSGTGGGLDSGELAEFVIMDESSAKTSGTWHPVPGAWPANSPFRLGVRVLADGDASDTISAKIIEYTENDIYGRSPEFLMSALYEPQPSRESSDDVYELSPPAGGSRQSGDLWVFSPDDLGFELTVTVGADQQTIKVAAHGSAAKADVLNNDDNATTMDDADAGGEGFGEEYTGIVESTRMDSINPRTGNLNMRIPVHTLATDGGLSYEVALTYNSKIWSFHHIPGSSRPCLDEGERWVAFTTAAGVENAGVGWDIRPPHLLAPHWGGGWQDPELYKVLKYFVDESGGRHTLYGETLQNGAGTECVISQSEGETTWCYTWDASNLSVAITAPSPQVPDWTVSGFGPSGTIYHFNHPVVPHERTYVVGTSQFGLDWDDISSPDPCGVDFGMDFREEISGFYATEIERGPTDAIHTDRRVGRIRFSYCSAGDTSCPQSQLFWYSDDGGAAFETPSWLPRYIDVLNAAGDVQRRVAFEYDTVQMTAETPAGLETRQVVTLDTIRFPRVGDPSPQSPLATVTFDVTAREFHRGNDNSLPGNTTVPFLDAVHFELEGSDPALRTLTYSFDYETPYDPDNPDVAGKHGVLRSVTVPSDESRSSATIKYHYGLYPTPDDWCTPHGSIGTPGCGPGMPHADTVFERCRENRIERDISGHGVVDRVYEYSDASGAARTTRTHYDPQLFCGSDSTGLGLEFVERLDDLIWFAPDQTRGEFAYQWTEVSTSDGIASPAPSSTVHRYHPLTGKEISTSVLTYDQTGLTLPNLGEVEVKVSDPAAAPQYGDGREIQRIESVWTKRHSIPSLVGLGTTHHEALYQARSRTITDAASSETGASEKLSRCLPSAGDPASSNSCAMTTKLNLVDDFLRPVCGAVCTGRVTVNSTHDHWTCANPGWNEIEGDGVSRWSVTEYHPGNPYVTGRFDMVELTASTEIAPGDSVVMSAANLCQPPTSTDGWTVTSRQWAYDGAQDWWAVEKSVSNPTGTGSSNRFDCSDDCVVHEYEYDSYGAVSQDSVWGGYGAGFIPNTSAQVTQVDRLRSDNSFDVVNRVIKSIGPSKEIGVSAVRLDESTGRPLWKLDGTGSGSRYGYDNLNRVVSVAPVVGDEASVTAAPLPGTSEDLRCQIIGYCEAGSSDAECGLDTRSHKLLFDGTPSSDGSTCQKLAAPDDEPLKVAIYDELGRTVEVREAYPDSSGSIAYRARRSRTEILDDGTHQFASTWFRLGQPVPGWSETISDALGRPVRTTLPDGSTSETAHHGGRNTVTTRWVKTSATPGSDTEFTTSVFTDGAGRTIRVEEQTRDSGATGTHVVSEYRYDHRDQLIGVEVFEGGSSSRQSRTFAYSNGGFLTGTDEPEINTTIESYDARGNPIKTETGTGLGTTDTAVTTNVYDEFGRITSSATEFGDIDSSGTWTYTTATPFTAGHNMVDTATEVVSIYESTHSTVTHDWDYLGPQSQVSQRRTAIGDGASRNDHTVTYTYDAWGLPLTQTVDGTGTSARQDRGLGGTYLTDVTLLDGGSAVAVSPLSYLPSGLIASLGLGGTAVQTTEVAEHGMARPHKIIVTDSGLGTPLKEFLAYDGSGNIKSIVQKHLDDSARGLTDYTKYYAYDGLNRLREQQGGYGAAKSSAGGYSYSYDEWGNLTTLERPGQNIIEIGVDENTNQCTTCGNYDGRGNLTSLPSGAQFTFSGQDRLLRAVDGSTRNFAYDVNGERVAEWGSSLADATLFIRDEAGQVLYEIDQQTGGQVFYFYAGSRLLAQNKNGILRYFGTDHLGNTRVVLDANGYAVPDQLMEYMPFGQLDPSSPPTPETDHLFTGHEREFDLGLDYMHARYYSPEFGRFLTVDPVGGDVGVSQSWNRYSYVKNNPTNRVDPTGMFEPGDTVVLAHVNDDGSTGNVGHTQTVLSDSTPDNDLDFESTVVVEYGSKTPHATEITLRSEDDPRKEMAIVGKVPAKDDDMTEQDVRQKLEEWRTEEGDPAYGYEECYNLSAFLTDRTGNAGRDWALTVRDFFKVNKDKARHANYGWGWWANHMKDLEGASQD